MVHDLSPDILLHLFADNWSYSTTDLSLHSPLLHLVQRLTQILHIPIDWSKTFCWATSDEHVQEWKNLRTEVPFANDLCRVSNARDLGLIMHYRCRMTRGPQQARHDLAIARLKRLKHQKLDYKVKGEIIQAACINKALYGTHAYAVGSTFFADLRTEIKYAMLGDKKNAQPHLACVMLTSSFQDPELHAIVQALLHARDYVHQATDEQIRIFHHLVATANKHPHTIVGPASALQFYIAKLGWQLNKTGDLLIGPFFQLHLAFSNWQDILRAADAAWMEHVSVQVGSRKGCRNMPVIDRKQTTDTFQAFPDEGKHALALQLTGAPMTGEQKTKFLETALLCPFCAEVDSTEHQVLRCQATALARHAHQTVCEELEAHDDIYITQPAIFRTDKFDYLRTLQFALPEAALALEGVTDGIFTDGTCQHPTSVHAKLAAYAVVFPVSPMQQVCQDVHLPLHTILSKHFSVAGVALLPGHQSINRAELFAVVQTHEQQLEVPVYTDSAYVLSRHQLILQTSDVRRLRKCKNFDLLQRWHKLVWRDNLSTPTYKLKAHQQLQADTELETWKRIGNAIADLVVKTAAQSMLPPYRHLLQEIHAEEDNNKRFFRAQLHLRKDLALFRKQLTEQPDQVQQFNPPATLHCYQTWQVTDGVVFSFSSDDHWIFDLSRWGTPFTHVLLQWVQSLTFPSQVDDGDCGISWLELLFNFMLQTQLDVPLRIEGRYTPFSQLTEWTREQFTINDSIVSFTGAIHCTAWEQVVTNWVWELDQ